VRILDKVITGKPGLKLKIDLSKLGMTAARMNALREFKVIQHSELLRRDIPHMTWIGSFVTDGNLTRIAGEHNTSAASIDKELPHGGPYRGLDGLAVCSIAMSKSCGVNEQGLVLPLLSRVSLSSTT
jgi:hypothetical protein